MLRTLLSLIGLGELLAPTALIDAAEQVTLENPEECELRSWIIPGARLEGLLLLALMWHSDRSYAAFKKFLGILGLIALLYPHEYIEYSSQLAYTEPSEPAWKGWIYPGTRLVGVIYVLIAADAILAD